MKRITVSLLLLIATAGTPVTVFAATKPVPTVKVTAVPVASAPAVTRPADESMPQKVDYTLPYPGMLADSPLYFLKEFRDWVMDMLIADPIKKVDFYVLQSDKELNASTFLIAKNESALAEKALAESTRYINKAAGNVSALKEQGKEVPGYVVERFGKSLAKHDEMLTDMEKQATGTLKSALAAALSEVQKLEANGLKLP